MQTVNILHSEHQVAAITTVRFGGSMRSLYCGAWYFMLFLGQKLGSFMSNSPDGVVWCCFQDAIKHALLAKQFLQPLYRCLRDTYKCIQILQLLLADYYGLAEDFKWVFKSSCQIQPGWARRVSLWKSVSCLRLLRIHGQWVLIVDRRRLRRGLAKRSAVGLSLLQRAPQMTERLDTGFCA